MKHLQLTRILLRRFRSYCQETVIDFDQDPGLHLIGGRNEVNFDEPDGNGAGKSSIWHALCFACYGASVDGARASDLITRGCTSTDVEVHYLVDQESLRIRRTSPPNRLYLNGEQVEQEAVNEALGLSKVRFLNSVVFGQDVPTFLDLPLTARGDLLEDVLPLQCWLKAARLAETKSSDLERRLKDLNLDLAHCEGELRGLPDLGGLRENFRQWNEVLERRKAELAFSYEEAKSTFSMFQSRKAAQKTYLSRTRSYEFSCQETRDRIQTLKSRLAVLREKEARLQEEDLFLTEQTVCPTCNQPISKDFSSARLEQVYHLCNVQLQRRADVQEQLREAEKHLKEQLLDLETVRQQDTAHERETYKLDSEIRMAQRTLETLKGRRSDLDRKSNPYARTINQTRKRELEIKSQISSLKETLQGLEGEQTQLQFWKQAFKRVRLFCLTGVLEQLEMETDALIRAFGLLSCQIGFTTETETRSGTARLGVQAEIQSNGVSVPYTTYSPGERQRIRLCAALGLANLIQDWSGVSYGFEVWDEPSAWLSEVGIEHLLQCLRDRAQATGKSIFLCDHRGLTYSGFKEVWTVVNDQNGSHIERNV